MTPEAVGQRAITVRLRRSFAAPRDKVFRAWTDPEALRKWWCPPGWIPAEIEINLRTGGEYRIGMRNRENGSLVSVCGSFLEVHRPERLVYTWHWENAFQGMPEMRVTVEFAESGPGTDITLVHENLSDAGVCLRHRAGWMAAWNRMEESCLKSR